MRDVRRRAGVSNKWVVESQHCACAWSGNCFLSVGDLDGEGADD